MKQISESYIDETASPTDDFFRYATGNWLKCHPQPLEYPRWGTFTALHHANIKKVDNIITRGCSFDPMSQKIKVFFGIANDYKRRDKDGVAPLVKFLEDNLYNREDRMSLIIFMARYRIGVFFDIFISIDDKDSSRNVLFTSQGGLGLGNKEYYTVESEANTKILKAYRKYFIDLNARVRGMGKRDASALFKRILAIERRIAEVSHSETELEEPSLNYNPMTVKAIKDEYGFNMDAFLKLWGYEDSDSIVIGQREHFAHVTELLNTMDVGVLKEFIIWNVISTYDSLLDEKTYNIGFRFSKAFSGATRKVPKRKRAVMRTNAKFSPIIGQLFVKRHFSQSAKDDVKAMVDNLISAYRDIINEQSWLSADTKAKAIEKLGSMTVKIGFPDKVDDYSAIPIDKSKTLLENVIDIGEYMFEMDKAKRYNKPVDRTEWLMDPHEVNAYYSPATNEICFPAGILQEPFYRYGRPAAMNYGSIGAIIGHEMTHGFDNHGRQYDKDGNRLDWWTEREIERFNELTRNTVERFDSLEALPGLKCNGTLTLGENLADYGGLKIAYRACEKILGRDGGWQTDFFTAYAVNYAGVDTEEGVRSRTMNDCHSIGRMRVNGTLPMFKGWKDTFKPAEGDAMFVEDEKMARIW